MDFVNANDRILRKIKIVKYGVDFTEVIEEFDLKTVLKKGASDYKHLWWYEKELASIIASNFRCKWYMEGMYLPNKVQVQQRIVFVGLEKDVELANNVYQLAIDALLFYKNRYIKNNKINGDQKNTNKIKSEYMQGFIDGLESKFKEQIDENEWGLILSAPKEVEEKSRKMDLNTIKHAIPNIVEDEHYSNGFSDGSNIDYKKEIIDDKIVT